MKRLLFGVVLAVITIIIQQRMFTDKPEILYSLSNEFYTSLAKVEGTEVFQQITIKNNGSLGAEKLVLSIAKHIDSYELKKYSETDSVKVYFTNEKFELLYNFLPPNGQIEVLLRNKDEGVTLSEIQVKHNHGVGTDVFSKQNTSYLPTLLFVIYLALLLFPVHAIYVNFKEIEIKYRPQNFLKSSRPIFLSSERWDKMRSEALKNFIESKDYVSSIEDLPIWTLLNNEKPTYLNNEEWRKIVTAGGDNFKRAVIQKILQESYLKNKSFSIKKPKNLPDDSWADMQKFIDDYYKYQLIKDSFGTSKNGLGRLLADGKPEAVSLASYNEVIDLIRKVYLTSLVDELIRFGKFMDVDEFTTSINKKLLTDDQQKEIDRILANMKQIQDKKAYSEKLTEILNGIFDDKKKNQIQEKDWLKLTELNSKISVILSDKEQASEDKIKFDLLRKKVEQQLKIIDKVLSDPDFITKIEEYNDIFNSGNFKNLKKVSQILKKNSGR